MGTAGSQTETRRIVLVIVVAMSALVLVGSVLGGSIARPDGTSAGGVSSAGVANQFQVASGFEGTIDAGDAAAKLSGEAANDTAGWSVASAGDVNGDGVEDVIVGVPRNDTAAGEDAGAAYIVFGPVDGDVDLSEADVTLTGEAANDRAGWSVASAGDVNDDGVDDVVVGAPNNDANGTNAGAAYVLYGGSWLDGTISLGEANSTLLGGPGDRAGGSVGNTSALEGGESGVVVGARTDSEAGTHAGAAFVVGGDSLGETVELEAEADAKLLGENLADQAGYSVASAGDVNDDGVDDLIVGAWRNDADAQQAGAAYVVFGPIAGTSSLDDADLILRGEAAFDHAGFSVSSAGDVNNDSVDDVVVGAPTNDAAGDDSGAAYLVFGSSDLAGERNLSEADVKLAGAGPGDNAGWSVADAGSGDVTCDAVADVLVGAPSNDSVAPDAGAAYLVSGSESLSGTRDLDSSQATFVGEAANDNFGHAVGSAGDQNGDGVDDVVFGAPYNDSTARDAGAAYLFAGDCPTPAQETVTATETATETETETATETATETETETATETATETETQTATATETPTETATATETQTETATETETRTATQTATETETETETATATETATETETQTATETETVTETETQTATETETETATQTATQTPTATPTDTPQEPFAVTFFGCGNVEITGPDELFPIDVQLVTYNPGSNQISVSGTIQLDEGERPGSPGGQLIGILTDQGNYINTNWDFDTESCRNAAGNNPAPGEPGDPRNLV